MVIDPVTLTAMATGANAIATLINGERQRKSTRENLDVSHGHTGQTQRERLAETLAAKKEELDHPTRLFTRGPEEFRRRVEALSRRDGHWQPTVLVTAFEQESEVRFGRTVREAIEGVWQIPDAPVAYGLLHRSLYYPDGDLFELHDALTDAPTIVLLGRVHKFGRRIEPRIAVLGIEDQVRPVSFRTQALDLGDGTPDPDSIRGFARHVAELAVMAADGLAWAVSGRPPAPDPAAAELPAENQAMLRAFARLGAAVHPERRGQIGAELSKLLHSGKKLIDGKVSTDFVRNPNESTGTRKGW
ncbi:MAG: hypothetical protein ABW224_16175 [Kibdelosporangium sp.]